MVKLSGEMAMGEHLELRFHGAMPKWAKVVGLKIKAVPKSEGGGFAVDREQAARLVACWDACRGVTTETLVKYGTEFPEVVADDITDRKRADAAEALLWRIRSLYGAGADPEKWDENEVDLHDEIRTFLDARTAPEPVKPGDEGEG